MEWNNWKDSFVEYIRNSDKYWGGPKERQNLKLVRIKKKLCEKYDLNDEEYLDFVLYLAEIRETYPKKVYISNIGGSGSHWLSKMIEEMLGWFDLGEVYVPKDFYNILKEVEDKELVRKFYDSIEMLHGFIYHLEVQYVPFANIINSAHSVYRMDLHQYLYPETKIIHLIRDPRDRTLSLTYRKASWRQEAHPEKSDKDYILYNANRANNHFFNYDAHNPKADLEVKYEDLKHNCVNELHRICELLEEKRPPEHIEYTAHKFSAKNLRKTDNNYLKGNLDEGGPSKPWHEKAKTEDLRIMHSILKPAIKGFKYRLGDCFGQEFDYNENIKVDRKTKRFLSKFNNNLSIFINGQWEKPTDENIDKGGTIKAVRLDAHGLDVKDIIKIVKKLEITVLCLSNLDNAFVKELLEELNDIEIKYLDVSKVKGFPIESLKKFKSLKAVNLSGCEVSKPEKLKAKVYMDY
jgi:hypothetical protein